MLKSIYKHVCWPRVKFRVGWAKCLQLFCIHIAKPSLHLTSPWMFALQNQKILGVNVCIRGNWNPSLLESDKILFIWKHSHIKMARLLSRILLLVVKGKRIPFDHRLGKALFAAFYSTQVKLRAIFFLGNEVSLTKAISVC